MINQPASILTNTPANVDIPASCPSAWVITTDTVFPHHANPLNTLFGGRALELMDVNASIACQRFCRQMVVTASIEPVDFHTPIYVGEIVEVKSKVVWVGTTSMIVRSEVHGENPLTGERRLCTIGHLNFVALKDGKPHKVPRLELTTLEDEQYWQVATHVRENILKRRQAEQNFIKNENPSNS